MASIYHRDFIKMHWFVNEKICKEIWQEERGNGETCESFVLFDSIEKSPHMAV